MKRLAIAVLGMVMVGMAGSAISWAEEPKIPGNQWEIGPEVYYFRYEEPNVNVKFQGPMYGIAAAFTHHNSNHLMLKAEGRGAYGEVDYTGSGTLDGIQDYAVEGRLAAGYDISLGEDKSLTPFFGLGDRYLNDDSSGKTSSTGASGYKRESNYLYSPIGLEFSAKLNDGWRIGVSAEYDVFWKGQQKSHLENVAAGLNEISNDQNHGYGARGSIKFQKTGERFDLVIGPYVRWWSIQDSELANVTYGGTLIGFAYEPKNETLEAGGAIAIHF